MYCLDKSIVLYGEKLFLELFEGWCCDIREDFVLFGNCFNLCLLCSLNFFEFGCSIGIFFVDFVGFVGFLVELKNVLNNYRLECGFLIVFYVVI